MYPNIAVRTARHRWWDRLTDAILSLQPTTCWRMDDGRTPLRDASGHGWSAAVTGAPAYRVAAPAPLGQGITWSGTGQYAESSASVPAPSSSVSVLVAYRAPSTSGRYPISRNDPSHSWATQVTGASSTAFTVYQAGGGIHASADSTGVVNDNVTINLLLGTFDGTTIRAHGQRSPAGQSSASLTGSWQKASSKITPASFGFAAGLLAGTTYLAAYWSDKVLDENPYRYLVSIAFGG